MGKIFKTVQPEYFVAVVEGKKPFEVRLADFACRPGDTLVLQEQKSGSKELTGREVELEVLYKFNTKQMERWHSKKEIEKHGLVVLAIRRQYGYNKD